MIKELEFGNDMRRGFQLTLSFRELYKEALIFHLIPHTDQEMEVFRNRFVGALFAGRALSNLDLLDRTLVSGSHLLDCYQKLYPYAEPIEHPLGQSSLNGVSVPDALLTSDGSIVAVCEATVSNDQSYFLRKYDGFRTTQRQSPELFGNARLIFITARDPMLPVKARETEDVDLIELPFTGKQFSDYIDRIYHVYRPFHDAATLDEIQTRVRQQFLRAEGNESSTGMDGNGQFTGAYRLYLSAVR